MSSDGNGSEGSEANGTTFNATSFNTANNDLFVNNNSPYVVWAWKGNGTGTAVSNSNGSIASTVSANTAAGFSVIAYTGNNGSSATVGHGLGAVPQMIIIKSRDNSRNWTVYHESLGNTKGAFLNLTNTPGTSSAYWNNTTPTSSVFSVGTEVPMNKSGDNIIAYCFAEKQGYSKFGSYVGTNSGANGPFIYTGFKPAFILIKNTTSSADWHIRDNKRDTYNASTHFLKPNSSDAEVTSGEAIDILSNGFKIKANGLKVQDSGNTYIYMAFAAAPLVGDNPATAR